MKPRGRRETWSYSLLIHQINIDGALVLIDGLTFSYTETLCQKVYQHHVKIYFGSIWIPGW